MTLPWERFGPSEPIAVPIPAPEPTTEPALPYSPPPLDVETANLPQRQPDLDLTDMMRDAFTQALRESGDALKDQAADYVRGTISATVQGKQVDHAHPTVTAVTETGRELVVADARSRSWRTLVQGLAIDLAAALLAVLATVTHLDPLDKATWTVVAALVIKTFVQTAMAYVMRLRVAPTVRERGEKMAIMPVQRPMLDNE